MPFPTFKTPGEKPCTSNLGSFPGLPCFIIMSFGFAISRSIISLVPRLGRLSVGGSAHQEPGYEANLLYMESRFPNIIFIAKWRARKGEAWERGYNKPSSNNLLGATGDNVTLYKTASTIHEHMNEWMYASDNAWEHSILSVIKNQVSSNSIEIVKILLWAVQSIIPLVLEARLSQEAWPTLLHPPL